MTFLQTHLLMKYQVYAALIATVSAGNVADDINDHMPTE